MSTIIPAHPIRARNCLQILLLAAQATLAQSGGLLVDAGSEGRRLTPDQAELSHPVHFEPALDILPKAVAAATRAVELDDRSADAHTSVGIVKMWVEWDWPPWGSST